MPDPANPSRSRHARRRLKRAIGSKRCGGSWPPAEPLSASVLAPAAREWAEQPVTEETLSAAAARSQRCCHSMGKTPGRSEEHTSELQSRGHLVCRLLLEKKKLKLSRHMLLDSSR